MIGFASLVGHVMRSLEQRECPVNSHGQFRMCRVLKTPSIKTQKDNSMSKGQDSKRDSKKKPLKTMLEKKAAKRDKKNWKKNVVLSAP